MTTAARTPAYLPHIDGLRAFAVLVILLFHLDVTFVKGGFVGVDVFFVISGFLITSLISRDIQAGAFSFLNFYARRIKRIFPALFVMLFVTSVVAIFFLGPVEYLAFFKALRSASGQISNILFSQDIDYFALDNKNNPLLHTWSLGVEEQFYLVWPILFLLMYRTLGLRRAAWGLVVVFGLSLAVSEYLVRTDAMKAFYLLHARAWELAVGALLGLKVLPAIKDRRVAEVLGWAGLACIGAAIVFMSEINFPGIKAVLPCVGAGLFIYAAQGVHGPVGVHKVFSVKPLVAVGLISYSLYLWHWPLVAFYKSYFQTVLPVAVQVALGVASFGLAWLSFRYVEQPLRHSRMADGKVVALGVLTLVSFIVGANIVKRAHEAPWRVTYSIDKDILEENIYYHAQCILPKSTTRVRDCVIGPNKDGYEVLLSGDSQAGHYIPTVLEWAKTRNLTVRVLLRGACRSFQVPGKTLIWNGKVDKDCMELQRTFHETVQNNPHIQYLFLSVRRAEGAGDLQESFERIATYGRKTIYLGSVPEFAVSPHDCQMKNHLLASYIFPRAGGDCMAIDHAYSDPLLAASRTSLMPVLDKAKIAFFDPEPLMGTLYDKEGRFLYYDTIHLNTYGALYLAPHLVAFMHERKL